MRIRFPIRYKFLVVTTLLLVFSVVSYLFLASHIFRRDKIELVFDLNRGAVSGLASDVSTLFRGIADKMKLAAVLSLSQESSSEASQRSKALLNDVLQNDSNIVFLAASYGFGKIDHVFFADKEFSETYGLSEKFFKEALAQERPYPFPEIQTAGEAVWNATIPNGPPLIGFGKSVVSDSGGRSRQERAPFAMIAFVRADKILQSFSNSRLNEVTAVNRFGEVLVSADPSKMATAGKLAGHPLFKAATAPNIRTGVLRFEHEGREILGAHSLSHGGKIVILSQVDGRHAFSAVESLVQRSLVFAMIAVTLAFLAAVFFSRSLTQPIQALVEATKKVSAGELQPTIDVKTRDEIALLASSFNSMLKDLSASRERLVEVNRDLETKVKDRTRRLEEQNIAVKKTQEALLQSTRMATVGEVAGRAAHEILNPLTSIVARLEKVRSRIQDVPVQEVELASGIVKAWQDDVLNGGFDQLVQNWKAPSQIDQTKSLWEEDLDNVRRMENAVKGEIAALVSDMDFVLKESNRINKIVQDMRALTRVKGDLKALSGRDLLREAVKVMADLAEMHGIQIVEEFADAQDQVKVDPDEFTQIITNLLRNSIQAVRAKKQGDAAFKGRILVQTQVSEGRLQIEIADNGVGIKDEHRTKLFEVQFSTKAPDEGTGLGLSISRRFIRAFGGDIELARSMPGEGCAFRIELPLVSETQRTAA